MRALISTAGQIAAVLAVVVMGAAAALAQAPSGKNEIGFLYAFGAYAGAPGKGRLIALQSEATLRAGDRLKLYFEPKNDQYLYLLHLSSQGELSVLYPAASRPARVARGAPVFIPAGDDWFELDAHRGQEKFFLVAAAERLDRLEELCARHAALTVKADAAASSDAILDEVKRLRQKNKPLSAPAEKPVRIGGSVRGETSSRPPSVADIPSLAAEVTAPGFYTRTFTIEHR